MYNFMVIGDMNGEEVTFFETGYIKEVKRRFYKRYPEATIKYIYGS
ncbi:hypothetical protein [Paraliobacillus ryukyuensis]|nr:hypothetical protein [Paraliobacillus ryukyuensis]